MLNLVKKKALSKIISNNKNFQDDIIGDPFLNKIGIHVFRILVSDIFYIVRSLPFFWKHPILWLSFIRNGFLVINNFLSESEFEALRPCCAKASKTYWMDNPLARTNEKGFGSKIYRKGGFDRFDGDSANRFIYIDKNSAINNIYCASPKMDSICKSLSVW